MSILWIQLGLGIFQVVAGLTLAGFMVKPTLEMRRARKKREEGR